MKLTKNQLQLLHDEILEVANKTVATREDHSKLRVSCKHLQQHINALDDDSSNPPGNPPPPPPGPGHG